MELLVYVQLDYSVGVRESPKWDLPKSLDSRAQSDPVVSMITSAENRITYHAKNKARDYIWDTNSDYGSGVQCVHLGEVG